MHHTHMDRKEALGRVIMLRRKAINLTQPQLADRIDGLDQPSLSKIERGKQGMTMESLEALASALGVKPGRLQMEADALLDQTAGEGFEATAFQLTQSLGVRHVPLISWVEAGDFAEAVDSYARGTGKKMIQTSLKVGRLAYALEVHGNSMNNPRDERRSFPNGTVIIVDPAREIRNGALIVARVEDEAETTFKQYVEDAGRRMLVPLNPQFPVIPIDQPLVYCGTVVGKAEEALDEEP